MQQNPLGGGSGGGFVTEALCTQKYATERSQNSWSSASPSDLLLGALVHQKPICPQPAGLRVRVF